MSTGFNRDPSSGKIKYDSPGEMARSPIPVKYQKPVDAALRSLASRSAYIRTAVIAALIKDGHLAEDWDSAGTESDQR